MGDFRNQRNKFNHGHSTFNLDCQVLNDEFLEYESHIRPSRKQLSIKNHN